MTKVSLAGIAFVVSSALVSVQAQADVNADLENICTIVKTDDKSQLRKKLKQVRSDYRLKLRDIYNNISCGGQSLIRVAMQNNAVETGSLMVKKLPKSMLSESEKDGKSLSQWASEQGLTSSPIMQVLNERI